MVQKAELSEIDEIIELKLSMFRESGHVDLLADDAKQIILQKCWPFAMTTSCMSYLIGNS